MSFEKDTHPNAYAFLMTLMHNTRSNVFLQSMKTNPLSVKKLMKNLILRTLRQLYTVSEIIIVLIRWVTPPPTCDLHEFEFSSSFAISSKLFKFIICGCSSFTWVNSSYSCIFEYFMSSIAFTYCQFFKLIFHLCECDRTRSPLC
jgi:hypothetical protein